MSAYLYEDPGFKITRTSVATPSRLYPLANATARLRRDPLWAGLAGLGFAVGCIAMYGDLLFPGEIVAAGGLALAALVVGSQFSILRLDTVGHSRALFFGPHRLMKRRFRAVCDARLAFFDPASLALIEHPDSVN